jgi:PAS domain S-box-containing protein
LPFIIVLPLVIGWLRLKGEQINLYPSDKGVVYVAITYTVILIVLVWITAKSVNSVDRKKQDIARELQESEERFKVIAEVSPIGMGVVGIPDGEFLYINPAYENHFGYGKDELLRKKSPDIYFDPYDREQVLNMLKENNFVINYEVRLKRKDGSSFWSLSTIKPIIFNNKPAYLGTFVDITLRKDAEEALKKSEMELIELNATKDKFFSIVAHDLKNPFTSLIGSSELLYTNIHALNTKDIKKLATILNDSAKGGYSILQNLLDWSRSQTGLLKISPQKLNLKELIEENILNLQLPASNKEISIINELTSDVYLVSDKNMINTVLRNLLSNAVKFTRKCGKVVISVKSESGYVIILVKDNGIGIASEKIEKLFSIETKNSMPGTENEQGTGLGLKLSKEFVEKLGGKIKARSAENEGSEFSFTIPIHHSSEKAVPGYPN